jgi:hypothetical protein
MTQTEKDVLFAKLMTEGKILKKSIGVVRDQLLAVCQPYTSLEEELEKANRFRRTKKCLMKRKK